MKTQHFTPRLGNLFTVVGCIYIYCGRSLQGNKII